jgi:hypothetical protein
MVCPRWVRTRIQPIAEADLLDALVAAPEAAPGVHEVGGPEVTTYRDLIATYAAVRGLRRRVIVDVPLLTPHLSSYWVDLVTPVSTSVSHALIESLTTEVVVRRPVEPPIPAAASGPADAIRQALDAQDADVARRLFDLPTGLQDGVYVNRVEVPVADADAVARDLGAVGGSIAWYGVVAGWRLRLLAGRLLGERLATSRPAGSSLHVGAEVDWWTVAGHDDRMLVLRSRGWFPGDGWIGWRMDGDRLVQVGAFRPRGVPGFLYWKLLVPVHRVVFRRMADHRAATTAGRARAPRAR